MRKGANIFVTSDLPYTIRTFYDVVGQECEESSSFPRSWTIFVDFGNGVDMLEMYRTLTLSKQGKPIFIQWSKPPMRGVARSPAAIRRSWSHRQTSGLPIWLWKPISRWWEYSTVCRSLRGDEKDGDGGAVLLFENMMTLLLVGIVWRAGLQ